MLKSRTGGVSAVTRLSLSLGKDIDMSFGEALRKIRSSKDISARALSDACGFSAAYMSKVESGASVPSAKAFSRILKELDCNVYEMAFLVGILMREEGLDEGKS